MNGTNTISSHWNLLMANTVKILRDLEHAMCIKGFCVGNDSVSQWFKVQRGFAANLDRGREEWSRELEIHRR
jgi:hypothetical protein